MKPKQRNRRKAGRKRPSVRVGRAPRTAEQFFVMSAENQDIWNRVVHVVSKMRADRVSLREASQGYGINPRTVIALGGSALRKHANGRYVAKPSDRLLRVLVIPTRDGLREVALRSSGQASQLGEYWTAVHRYLETGDASKLRNFSDKYITDASRVRIPFLTDLKELDRLGNAGVLSFESLYARVG